jgi:Clp amino terminal domain, pathogenicity island component/UvrB/uvrC motif
MFERFTDQARQVIVAAQEEARNLGHDYIGTEHLLLGLAQAGSIAGSALERCGVSYDAALREVDQVIGRGRGMSGHVPLAPNAKKALQLALRESMRLGDGYIDTEHLLLGLIREGTIPQRQGPAMEVLARLGADPANVRDLITELRGSAAPGHASAGAIAATSAAGRLAAVPGRGKRRAFSRLEARLELVESRLSALERRVGGGPGLPDIDLRLAAARSEKEAAIAAQDFERAAMLRDTEEELAGLRAARQREASPADASELSLTEEIKRLRKLLREHGIEPRDGAA